MKVKINKISFIKYNNQVDKTTECTYVQLFIQKTIKIY